MSNVEPFLRRRVNTTSQIAIVGSSVFVPLKALTMSKYLIITHFHVVKFPLYVFSAILRVLPSALFA